MGLRTDLLNYIKEFLDLNLCYSFFYLKITNQKQFKLKALNDLAS